MTHFILGFLALAVASSLKGYSQPYGFRKDNLLLPDRLLVLDRVPFDSVFTEESSSLHLDNTSMPLFGYRRELDILRVIANKAVQGAVKVYSSDTVDFMDPLNPKNIARPMGLAEIRQQLGERNETTYVLNEKGEETCVVRKLEMALEELVGFNFIEEWAFTISPLRFTKNVMAYMPIRRWLDWRSDFEDDYHYTRPFVLLNPQAPTKPEAALRRAAQVKYELFFNADYGYNRISYTEIVRNYLNNQTLGDYVISLPSYSFLSTLNQRILVKTLVENAIEGKSRVLDYDSDKPIFPSDIRSRAFRNETVTYYNADGELRDTIVTKNITDEIRSVVFIEDWFFDTETMRMQKKVTGIAPVRYYYDSSFGEDDLIKREVLFVVCTDN
jgi:hypothetical protein